MPSCPPVNLSVCSSRSVLLGCRRAAALLLFLLALPLVQQPAYAQPPAAQRIFEGDPFDRLTLDDANENAVLRVRTIQFPNRQPPAKPKPSDKLRVKLIEDGKDYDIAWQNIKKVELFENIVLDEARQLAAAGKIDEAFDYFSFLVDQYPRTEGLVQARQLYLFQSAIFAFKQKNYAEALGILEELHTLNPDFRATDASPTVVQSLGSMADNLIGTYVAKNDYRSARILLERLVRMYQAGNEPFATKWIAQLSELAVAERDKAQALLAEQKFVEAYDASTRMRNIWPAVPGGEQLLTEMSRRYPLVMVGVSQPAKAFDSRSLVDPAARRAGKLVQRQLMDFASMGPEGGKYTSPYGSFVRSDDGTNFTFEVKPPASGATLLSAFDLSQRLLQLADPSNDDYQAAWSRLVSAVQVKQGNQVQVDLRLPHVLPAALLQVDALQTTPESRAGKGFAPYQVFSAAGNVTRFARNERSPFVITGQPAEILERYFDDPQRAILALKRGEIDVLDQVYAADVASLMQDSNIVVKQYAAPTTHMLLINRENPYLANRTFRRSLLYATDRNSLLQQGWLKGQKLPGWRVISGVFPAPSGTGDNVAYGYDDAIAPRDYDPRLALILKVLTQRQLKAEAERKLGEAQAKKMAADAKQAEAEGKTVVVDEKKNEAEVKQAAAPKLQPLVLGHPADEGSRLACRVLVKQWQLVGIEVKLQEFPLGVFLDPQKKCDLTYVHAATWEPIIDAARLFGAEGLTPTDNAYMRLAIKQIESATNWQQVRQRMQQLHQLVHEDVTVIPLWQTYDYYAYRQNMTGLETNRATLYQNVQQWQPAARLARN
jgi:tetratricopeptide (TPR) repeat protein